jgi:hypothetical protein
LIIFGTAAYLGMAIFGWGGPRRLLRPPGTGRARDRAVRARHGGAGCRRQLEPGRREDRANRWVIVAFGLIGLFEAYLPAWRDRNEFWIIGGDAVRWLGVVLFAAGGALRIWPVFVLGPDSAGW